MKFLKKYVKTFKFWGYDKQKMKFFWCQKVVINISNKKYEINLDHE
jgi:hypothetical protein